MGRRVLVLGAGPIEIGQAAEFDYAGTQACQALREEGIEVILLNSNPATIMTDPQIGERVYIEPLTCEVVERIIQQERPDAILGTMGGQTGLNLAVELEKRGILTKWGIPLLGTDISTIRLAEDRRAFRDFMQKLQQPTAKSVIIEHLDDAEAFAHEIGLPLVVRPAYTLGGTGGGIAATLEELRKQVTAGIRLSPIGQVLLEQSIGGLTEVEYEVLRDQQGNAVIVCDLENLDPVGIHTGDSIVVAPCQTLSFSQREMLEEAALKIVNGLKVVGSCNVQFALDTETDQYYVIEVNPRVSRSSALASKATGFPIAKVAAKLALGLSLTHLHADERPMVDYVVTKLPRWPFDKFPTADRRLGTQMKSTGEVMAVGRTFAESLQKAVRSLELHWQSLFHFPFHHLPEVELEKRLRSADDERLFLIVEALYRGMSTAQIHALTGIKPYFLLIIKDLVDTYKQMRTMNPLDPAQLLRVKQLGFSDEDIGRSCGLTTKDIRSVRQTNGIKPTYYSIKTTEGSFYYSSYDKDVSHKNISQPSERKVVVLGSGPIRIGQGIEFDFSTVHAAWTLRNMGYESIIINNNPETVSTDSTVSQHLYFEPLTEEDVWEVIQYEKPLGVLVQFGGQTAINLADFLEEQGVSIFGTSAGSTAGMEDRHQFDEALEKLNIHRPKGRTADTKQEAVDLADQLAYPVVIRPSYVLGGRGMEVINNKEELYEYLKEYSDISGYPLLIDNYVPGIEIEVDAICDGENVFLPGIMEHLERAGVHSGDSIAVFPAQSLTDDMIQQVYECTRLIGQHFQVKGFINIQFVISDETLYVLEVNPRSSRTVPFLSKVTGIPLPRLAVQVSLGETLTDLGYLGLLERDWNTVAVKVPVFSFAKLKGMEVTLGPEMKSTGEVMGRDRTLVKALYKGFLGANVPMPRIGQALITVADKDKKEVVPLAHQLSQLGMELICTIGTAKVLKKEGILCQVVPKLDESNEILELIQNREVDMVVNTYTKGKQPHRDGFRIRTSAAENGVLCFTALDTVQAYVRVVEDQALWVQPLLAGRRYE